MTFLKLVKVYSVLLRLFEPCINLMASQNGYKRRCIAAARSVATSAVTTKATQHPLESDNEHFSEHSDLNYCEIAPPSPKQSRICNDDIDSFGEAFQSNCYDSTSCESYATEDSDSSEKLRAGLAEWVNEYQIKHNAVDRLLKILRDSGHDQLPGSARSLIKTARYVPLT